MIISNAFDEYQPISHTSLRSALYKAIKQNDTIPIETFLEGDKFQQF